MEGNDYSHCLPFFICKEKLLEFKLIKLLAYASFGDLVLQNLYLFNQIIMYALLVFVPLELMLNVYRISRLTNWGIGTVNILTSITLIIEMIVGTLLFLFLTKKWLDGQR